MKNVVLPLAFVSASSVLLASDVPVLCNAQDSVLCSGIVVHAELEEDEDYHRIDALSGLPWLLEFDGEDVPRTAGKLGSYGVRFDTTSSGLRVPFGGPALGGIGPYTIAMWMAVDGDRDGVIFDAASGTEIAGPRLSYNSSTKKLEFLVTTGGSGRYTSSTVSSAATLSSGSWNFVVVGLDPIPDPTTKELVKVWLRVNGEPTNSINLEHSVLSSVQDLVLGSDNGDSAPFDGRIDSLTIWSRTLNDNDLEVLYNGGLGQTYPFGK